MKLKSFYANSHALFPLWSDWAQWIKKTHQNNNIDT